MLSCNRVVAYIHIHTTSKYLPIETQNKLSNYIKKDDKGFLESDLSKMNYVINITHSLFLGEYNNIGINIDFENIL